MQALFELVILNLEKVGIGAGLFLGAYLANMGLGAWKNVTIEGYEFDWRLIGQSIIKYLVLIVSLGFLSVVISLVPAYASFIGIDIGAETLETIDSLVVIGAFMTATIKYIGEAIGKVKNILTN